MTGVHEIQLHTLVVHSGIELQKIRHLLLVVLQSQATVANQGYTAGGDRIFPGARRFLHDMATSTCSAF